MNRGVTIMRQHDRRQRGADGADRQVLRQAQQRRARRHASRRARRAGRSPVLSFAALDRVEQPAIQPLDLELRLEVGRGQHEVVRPGRAAPRDRRPRPARPATAARGARPRERPRSGRLAWRAAPGARRARQPTRPSASAPATATSSHRSCSRRDEPGHHGGPVDQRIGKRRDGAGRLRPHFVVRIVRKPRPARPRRRA